MPKPETLKLFHGTSSENLADINKHGLRAKRYKPGEDGIWLTDKREVAEKFSEIATDEKGGESIIFEVEVKKANLTPDFIMYDMPEYDDLDKVGCDLGDLEKSEKCWQRKIRAGKVPYPKNDKDCIPSLEAVHSVISIKPIPKTKIKQLK